MKTENHLLVVILLPRQKEGSKMKYQCYLCKKIVPRNQGEFKEISRKGLLHFVCFNHHNQCSDCVYSYIDLTCSANQNSNDCMIHTTVDVWKKGE